MDPNWRNESVSVKDVWPRYFLSSTLNNLESSGKKRFQLKIIAQIGL